MTDAAKNVVWKALYEPFGAVSSITGAAANAMRFPGQWFQLEAGLHYNWWRHYDPTLGRYTQVDPLGLSQGPTPNLGQATASVPNGTPGIAIGITNSSAGASEGQVALFSGLASLGADGRQQASGLGAEYGAPFNIGLISRRDGPSLYGYGGQTPLMKTDPTGQWVFLLPVIRPVIGGLIGTVVDASYQYYHYSCVDWGLAIGRGGVAGAFAGLSGAAGPIFGRLRYRDGQASLLNSGTNRLGWSWNQNGWAGARNYFGPYGGTPNTSSHWHVTPIPGSKTGWW